MATAVAFILDALRRSEAGPLPQERVAASIGRLRNPDPRVDLGGKPRDLTPADPAHTQSLHQLFDRAGRRQQRLTVQPCSSYRVSKLPGSHARALLSAERNWGIEVMGCLFAGCRRLALLAWSVSIGNRSRRSVSSASTQAPACAVPSPTLCEERSTGGG